MSRRGKKEADHRYYLKNKKVFLLKAKEYYGENSEAIKARTRQWYEAHKDDPEFKKMVNERSAKYYLKNRETKLLRSKNRWLEARLLLLNYLGGECVRCGFSDYRALQVDHVDGGGVIELNQLKSGKFPLKYLEIIKKNRSGYQLLCANCNWIKKYENEENAQKRINK